MMEKRYLRIIILLLLWLSATDFSVAASDPQDTTKEVKRDIIKWEYNLTKTERYRVDMDTSMDFFYLYEPNGSIADYLVNVAEYASPSFSLLFTPKSDPFCLRAFENSFVSADDIFDYTAQRPYSNLFYSQGLNSEQSAKFIHTQNVNKYCNLGLDLNFYRNLGEFDNQSIKGQHVTPWIVYYGPRFSTTFKYAFNNVIRRENGGIAEDSLLNYEKLLRMKFPEAESALRYQNVEFVQKWNIGRKPKEDSTSLDLLRYKNALGYKLNYSSVKRFYSDKYPDTSFYANVLYDSVATNDSLFDKYLENSVFVEFQRKIHNVNVVANFAVGVEYMSTVFHDYNYSIPEYFSNSQFYEGSFDFSFVKNTRVEHRHRFYFSGEDRGCFSLYTKLAKLFNFGEHSLDISAYQDYSSSYLGGTIYDFESNHYSWHNDFDAEKVHDLNCNVHSSWGNLEADVHYYLMKDFVAFDENCLLQQIPGSGHAFTAKVQKTTRFWHILMNNGLIYQNIETGLQEYPTWATYNSLAFQGAFLKKLIHFGIGAELLYYPSYKTPTYDGVLGEFIPQSTYEYGGFPLVNVFATIKYKPIRLYVKYTNLYALLDEQNFTIAHYPQSNGTVSFGLSWLFYN